MDVLTVAFNVHSFTNESKNIEINIAKGFFETLAVLLLIQKKK